MFRSYSIRKLESLIDWISENGRIAYECLATVHFPMFADQIRLDLEQDFTRIRNKYIEDNISEIQNNLMNDSSMRFYVRGFESQRKIMKTMEEKAREAIGTRLEGKIDKYIRDSYAASALAGLAMHGEENDVRFARKFLHSINISTKTEAARIILRFGDESDVSSLLDLASESYGDLKRLAIQAALKLSPGPEGAVQTMLKSGESELVRESVRHLRNRPSKAAENLMSPLLSHKDGNIRCYALSYFVANCTKGELEKILSQYIESPTYYYNVVCWLDRVLFAPPPLNSLYRQELDEFA